MGGMVSINEEKSHAILNILPNIHTGAKATYNYLSLDPNSILYIKYFSMMIIII